MIIFKFTFLLAFNTESEEFKEKKNKSNEEKGQTADDDESKREYELKTGELIANLRIEYELLPKKFKYSIDITCWRNVAKISISEAFRYYRTQKLGNLLWIPVTIHHFFKGITEDDLVNLHSNIITFNVNTLKKDTISKFSCLYCLKNEANSKEFVEYFETDPNKPGNYKEKADETEEFTQLSNKCKTSDSIISWLRFRGKTHLQVVYATISSVDKGNDIKFKQFESPSELSIDLKTVAKSKTKKNEERKKDPYFIVPGEVFFTDPTLAVYRLKEENNFLSLGYVLLSVKNLMTREQKNSLNPFIVKIKKLHCIPVELLEQHGYNEIFVSYDIPFLAKYDSLTKPIKRTINFDESHAHFTKDLSTAKYLEFLRSERVKVHIKGVREEKNRIQPALFGTKKGDENFSKRMQPREAVHFLRKEETFSKIQTLAIANYDISSLLEDGWFFREQASCYHPDNLLHGIRENTSIKLADILTKAEINLADIDREKSVSPLSDEVLTSELTSLDMEFYFLAPQSTFHYLENIPNYFKRFFITFYNSVHLHLLLASILEHNYNLIGSKAFMTNILEFMDDALKIKLRKRNLAEQQQASDESLQHQSQTDDSCSVEFMDMDDTLKIELRKRNLAEQQQASDESLQDELSEVEYAVDDVITGFLIYSGSERHIFVEGYSHGYILEIWNEIHTANTSDAKVFLNSETEFGKRLYEDFLLYGIYSIKLEKPLEEIFQEQDIYVQGMFPVPACKALQKLDLLLRTDTLHEMLKQELFPTSNELLSLDLAFGNPFRKITW